MTHISNNNQASRPYASAYDHPRHLQWATENITRANIHRVQALLGSGESLDAILTMLQKYASNAAIMHITSHNQMIGVHREDFRLRGMRDHHMTS